MAELLPKLPRRPPDGHKGTFGTVCVLGGVAGSSDDHRVMIGGAALSALGALRSGCGLAVLAMPEPILHAGLTIAPSATGLALPVDRHGALKPSDVAQLLDSYLPRFHCIAIGPGLGAGTPQQQVVARLINQDQTPLVIDADAINALAALRDFHRDLRAHAVFTPHPGEYRRLAEALGIQADSTLANERNAAAEQLAQRLGAVIVLKGHRTVISDGQQTFINESGNAALATAGTGDVLTGIIAGLIAQFHKPSLGSSSRQITAAQQGGLSLLECARIGVHIHGLAADQWAQCHGQAGMLATDLLERIPDAMRAG